jgi:hypothetical protein
LVFGKAFDVIAKSTDRGSRILQTKEQRSPVEPGNLANAFRDDEHEALLFVDADRETRAALAAAIGKNFLTARSLHPSAEAMGAKSAEVVGLVRALHNVSLGKSARSLWNQNGHGLEQ